MHAGGRALRGVLGSINVDRHGKSSRARILLNGADGRVFARNVLRIARPRQSRTCFVHHMTRGVHRHERPDVKLATLDRRIPQSCLHAELRAEELPDRCARSCPPRCLGPPDVRPSRLRLRTPHSPSPHPGAHPRVQSANRTARPRTREAPAPRPRRTRARAPPASA